MLIGGLSLFVFVKIMSITFGEKMKKMKKKNSRCTFLTVQMCVELTHPTDKIKIKTQLPKYACSTVRIILNNQWPSLELQFPTDGNLVAEVLPVL